MQCDLLSSILQLKVKHQLLHNCSFDDQTSTKRHTLNISNSLIHQRKLLLYFLIHLKKIHVIFVGYSWNIQGIFLYSIFPEYYLRIFPSISQGTFSEYSGNISWECSTNIPESYICPVGKERRDFCQYEEFKFVIGGRGRLEVFCKKGIPKTFRKLTGKHLCQSLFFNKFGIDVFL